MLNDLKELIAIKSVMGTEAEGAPFGAGPKQALDWFLAKAKGYGLSTGQLDGYCGWAEIGQGQELIAALCHLDVVPAGEGWVSDPFTLLIENDRLYGRGVADDKGAAVMCLHALKEIKESGAVLNKRLRLIVGLNEEHGSACLKYYCKNGGEIPTMSFVPDSEFPVINSEKGILHLGVRIALDKFFEKNIAFISGGQSINVIPDRAQVSIFKDSPIGRQLLKINDGAINNEIFAKSQYVGGILAAGLSLDSFLVKNEDSVITFEAKGTAGHAMAPKNADNAIWKIFKLLEVLDDQGDGLVELMNQYFCTHLSAERLNIDKSDAESGDTTISMGIIEVDDDNLYFTLDLRLPISLKPDDAKKNIMSAIGGHCKIEVIKSATNLYIDPKDTLVKTLLEVYSSVSGQEGYCIKSGGGTYARELPNAVAFGPAFPGVETCLHKAGESLSVQDFFKAAKIYKEAFIRLSK